eukprot:GCRY01000907.1.p1 GENE.GCRY01000907.1~~GCRY01000907.1.p1  ORF type:complete len:311 (+),score=43.07 GCRY01000907.1:80-1012(+)
MVFEGDKLLFTPGPLNTSLTVKEAMLHDVGSRDVDFIRKVKEIREMILNVAQSTTSGSVSDLYDSVVMQGSGTFSVESVLGTTIAPSDKILILKNGVYGARMCKICERLSIKHTPLNFNDNEAVSVSAVESALKADPAITHVAVVHCETTTGIFNDVTAIGQAVKAFNDKIVFFVDAMSSFGGVELDLIASQIDYLVSSSNKCIQGVPGFGFIIFKKAALEKCKDLARSLALDLYAQWKNLSSTGQFLYTPPTHSLLAFHQALVELEAEGGVKARAARYRQNFSVLVRGTVFVRDPFFLSFFLYCHNCLI